MPGKVHGQRSLAGCSPWGYMTEHAGMRVEVDGLVAITWVELKKKKKRERKYQKLGDLKQQKCII